MSGGFSEVARRRPVAIVQPGTALPPAPYAAVESDLDPAAPSGRVALRADGLELAAVCDGRTLVVEVTGPEGRTERHRSRRHGVVRRPDAIALSLTGPVVTGWTREAGRWLARARVDLADPAGPAGPAGPRSRGDRGRVDVHDPTLLAGLRAEGERSGVVGQLGLRDLRVVSEADGTAYDTVEGARGELLLTATSAGPAGFRTAHASVWALDLATLELAHRGDLFARRAGPDGRVGVYGDHAVHLLREGGDWLLAGSTWGDFDRRHQHVTTTLARTGDDLRSGTHVLDTAAWELPTTGLTSVGVWDPHLVHTGEEWLVAYVSATRFFAFHPVLAAGPGLDDLTLRAAAADRVFTEGPCLVRSAGAGAGGAEGAGGWLLAASDGREGRRAHPIGYPLFATGAGGGPALTEVGRLRAAYPTNLPWPSVVDLPGGDRLMLGFDGTPAGGRLTGYGTHGDVVIQREIRR